MKAEDLAKQISGIQPRTPLAEAMLEKHIEAIKQYANDEAMDCVFDYAKYLVERINNPILPSMPVGMWFNKWLRSKQKYTVEK